MRASVLATIVAAVVLAVVAGFLATSAHNHRVAELDTTLQADAQAEAGLLQAYLERAREPSTW
jgi:hypothetical protein